MDIRSIAENNHGPFFWKFDNSLLDDTNYISIINKNIQEKIVEIDCEK
jgi:hypothetical protein